MSDQTAHRRLLLILHWTRTVATAAIRSQLVGLEIKCVNHCRTTVGEEIIYKALVDKLILDTQLKVGLGFPKGCDTRINQAGEA